MDIENEKRHYSYYKYSENGIQNRNYNLWDKINKSINYNISFKEKFYLFENGIKNIPVCECGNSLKFVDMTIGYRVFCSRKCMFNSDIIKKKKKQTNIKKYGVDNPSKSPDIKIKVKKTNNIKFGCDWAIQNNDIRNKSIDTNIKRYGVNNPSKNKKIRNKAKETMVERYGVEFAMHSNKIKEDLKSYFMKKYGVDNPSKVNEFRDKARKTNIERYGVENALQNELFVEKMRFTTLNKYGKESYPQTDEYKNKMLKFIFTKNSEIINNDNFKLLESKSDEYLIFCTNCNKEFRIQRQLWRNRIRNNINICLNCNPIISGISIDEKLVLSFISENYDGKIIENYKNGKEIDIYLPDLNIGFEFNGLYWHSELNKSNSYHSDKYKYFEKIGISIIGIWEDDWKYKKDIIKSMIINKLGRTSNKIFARKCEIKEIIDNQLIRNFLEKNHIQGFVGSKIKIGLFNNDELVSIMTFGNLRKSLGQKSKEGSYELLRFCNSLNTNVVGGASKLLSFFIKKYNPINIITYSLNTYSNGDLYNKIGFKLISQTPNNYFWVKNTIRYHRFNFRKDKLIKEGFDRNKTEIEIMYERGYYRVFDGGSKKWILEQGDRI